MKKIIWISWEKHRRTRTLVKKIKIPLFEFSSHRSRFVKFPKFILQTFWVICREKPNVLIVQNPSFILALLAILFYPLFRYSIVVDSHNAGVYPTNWFLKKFPWILSYIHRQANMIIVTNPQLASIVEKNNGRPVVLPDALPDITPMQKFVGERGQFTVTCICSFGEDEPYHELLQAGQALPSNFTLNITGNYKDAKIDCGKSNVVLTGYLPEKEYINLLERSTLVMVLTTRKDCMVCGAYEALSLEKPLILSESPVLQSYFYKGVVYTKNNASDIEAAILNAKESFSLMSIEIKKLKKEIDSYWGSIFERFLRQLDDL